MSPADVIRFWFVELSSEQWWQKDARLDAQIRARFESTHAAAARGELFAWRATAEGRLAEIIVLDQFSRNIYRDTPRAFACDTVALVLAEEAIARGADVELLPPRRSFMYMPYMHSESRLIHERAVELFAQPGLEGSLEYELNHKRIIDRFGRFPHRNAALSRPSTTEEIEFLKQAGPAF
jgi:uncharacterized protein (DUF924 family)